MAIAYTYGDSVIHRCPTTSWWWRGRWGGRRRILCDAHANTDAHTYTYANANANTYANANTNAYTYTDANTNAYAYTNAISVDCCLKH